MTMKGMFKSIVVVLMITLVGCQGGNTQQSRKITAADADYAFVNVSVLPMTSETVLTGQTVLIKDGRIDTIGNSEAIEVLEGVSIINGEGKFLMPGLAEMHAHIPGNQNQEFLDNTLFLYLSNGITTIRGMLGQPYHLELREKVANGEVLAPRIFTSSPSLNGNSVQSVEEANEKVRQYKEDGYDFLKMHPGIKMEVFNEIDRVADEVGITYSGHVSNLVGIRRAIEAGYASIDHIDGYLEGLVPEDAGVDPTQNGFFGLAFTDLANENAIEDLVNRTAEAGIWIVPTQSLMERYLGPIATDQLTAEAEMRFISRQQLVNYQNGKNRLMGNPEYSAERVNKFNSIRKSLLKAMQDGGVGILLGSDAPQVFNIPGFAIQHELKYMIEAGLTPYQCLVSGTVNPAKFFGMEGEFGQITAGAAADLILLDANPLEEITNLQQMSGVMVAGRWLSKGDIDERLEAIATSYGN